MQSSHVTHCGEANRDGVSALLMIFTPFCQITTRKRRGISPGINIHHLIRPRWFTWKEGAREEEWEGVWEMGQGVVTGGKPPTLTTEAWVMRLGWHSAVGQGHYTGSAVQDVLPAHWAREERRGEERGGEERRREERRREERRGEERRGEPLTTAFSTGATVTGLWLE